MCACAVGAPKIGLADGPAWYDASCAVCHSRKEQGRSAPQAADRKQRRISRIGPAGPKISSVKKGDVEIRYVKTSENIADFFTKFQPIATFRIHRDILMGIRPVKRA